MRIQTLFSATPRLRSPLLSAVPAAAASVATPAASIRQAVDGVADGLSLSSAWPGGTPSAKGRLDGDGEWNEDGA